MDADPTAPGQGRKLASIVSIDITGYSRLAEADEAAALAAVNAVRSRIDRAAATHGGRLFSSAGDGFMLEFPTASGALSAAEEIAHGDGPTVRVGVHLGEVFFTDSGDMLGHGVNIAARIQHLAPPGGVLVSADVKRSVRGETGARLAPRGAVKLEKMEETLELFQLDSGAPSLRGRWGVDWRWAVAATLAAGAVFGVASMLARAPPAEQARVAVLPFRTPGDDAALRAFSDGLSDRIVGALSSRSFLAISPQETPALSGPDSQWRLDQLGIRLVLDGAVQGGATITVDARLEDVRSRSVLWSAQLQDDAAHASTLQARVAARIVAELYCAGRALDPAHGLSDPATLSAYLRACDLFLVHSDDNEATYRLLDLLRQVTVRAPGFSAAHSDIAKYEAFFLDQFPVDQVASIRTNVEQESRRALELDPHNADAYVALYLLLPPTQWSEGEGLLRRGLAIDPDWPHANGFLGNLLSQTGRLQEAAVHYRRAAAANPLSGGLSWSGESAVGLERIGRIDLADQMLSELTELWSNDDSDVWRVRFEIAFAERRWDAGLALLEERETIPKWFTPADIAAFREFFLAAKSGAPARIQAERRALLDAEGRPSFVIRALASLGFKDDAFAVIERMSDRQLAETSLSYYLFSPPLAPLRHDRRFMSVASRLGLIAYWRAAGVQPDFCREPNLPYDCLVEEERVQPAAGR